MAYKLERARFRVRCKEKGCSFNSTFTVTENMMAETVADLENETRKIALNKAALKHDAVHGRYHKLDDPDIRKSALEYSRIGAQRAGKTNLTQPGVEVRKYNEDEIIVERGEPATTICEVLSGSAYPDQDPDYVYEKGEIFGASALASNRERMASIVAGEDDTTIAFYNLVELGKSDPQKAKQLYNRAMDDMFEIIHNYAATVFELEKDISKLERQNTRLKEENKKLKG